MHIRLTAIFIVLSLAFVFHASENSRSCTHTHTKIAYLFISILRFIYVDLFLLFLGCLEFGMRWCAYKLVIYTVVVVIPPDSQRKKLKKKHSAQCIENAQKITVKHKRSKKKMTINRERSMIIILAIAHKIHEKRQQRQKIINGNVMHQSFKTLL